MKVTLTKVRLSFPAVFKPKKANEKADPKYSASFLLDEKADAAQIDSIRGALKTVAMAKWNGKIPKEVIACLRSGEEKPDMPGYGKGIKFLNASNEHRPSVVDRDLSPIVEEDGKIYAGCFVNVVVRLWAQDNYGAKRINAQLCGIQFVSDGEAFGEKPFNAQEEFQKIDEPGGNGEEQGERPAEEGDPDIPF